MKASSRANDLNISTRKLRAFCATRMHKMDVMLIDMAGKFGDVDEGIRTQIDEARDHLNELAKAIGESCAWLDLPAGEDA